MHACNLTRVDFFPTWAHLSVLLCNLLFSLESLAPPPRSHDLHPPSDQCVCPCSLKGQAPLRSDCSLLSLVDDFPGLPVRRALCWTQFIFSEPDFTNLSFLAHLNNNYKYIKVVLLLNNVTCSYKCGMVRFFWILQTPQTTNKAYINAMITKPTSYSK